MSALSYTRQRAALDLAQVAMPGYVSGCEPWEWNGSGWARLFTVREWQVGAAVIAVFGEQAETGDVAHWLHVGGDDQLRSSDRSRFAEALAEARGLVDALE